MTTFFVVYHKFTLVWAFVPLCTPLTCLSFLGLKVKGTSEEEETCFSLLFPQSVWNIFGRHPLLHIYSCSQEVYTVCKWMTDLIGRGRHRQTFLKHCCLRVVRVRKGIAGERQLRVSPSLFLSRSTVAFSSWVVWFGDSSERIKTEIAAMERNSWDRAHSAQTHVDNGSFSFHLPCVCSSWGGYRARVEESADVKLSMEWIHNELLRQENMS